MSWVSGLQHPWASTPLGSGLQMGFVYAEAYMYRYSAKTTYTVSENAESMLDQQKRFTYLLTSYIDDHLVQLPTSAGGLVAI